MLTKALKQNKLKSPVVNTEKLRQFTCKKISNTYSTIRQNFAVFLLSVFVVSGLILGAIISKACSSDTFSLLDIFFASNLQKRISDPIVGNFTSSVSSQFIFLLVITLLGFSLWGFVITWIIPIIKGLNIGILGGYLCLKYSLSGFLFYILIFLPGAFVSALVVVIATKESMNLSLSLCDTCLTPKLKISHTYISNKTFSKRIGILSIASIASSVLDVILTLFFSKFFQLF